MIEFVVYPDVLFFENFLMDYLVLWCVGRFLKLRIVLWRLCLGTVLGATYSLLVILISGYGVCKIFCTYGCIAAGMLLIAFGRSSPKFFLKKMMILYICSFFVSGCMNFCFSLFGLHFTLATVISFLLLKKIFDMLSREKERRSHLHRVKIQLNNWSLEVNAYLDTGNQLVDPLSGKPVSVLEKRLMSACSENLSHRYRYIPFSSLGQAKGAMDGILADRMYVDGRKIDRPVIALYEGELSVDGSYHMLLNVADNN